MNRPSIELRDLTKRFGDVVAVDGLTLTLEGPKCVGFLGPNGAGKTTAFKLLTDMIRPSRGEALLNGIRVREDRGGALAGAGVLIETPEIYPALTPREALEMVADLRGVPVPERRSRIEGALGEVRMTEFADRKFGTFSKGMKQRINVACALVHDPEILVLDEPATGLDPRGMSEIREIVRGLKRRNRLVFLSSHILAEVTEVCDEVALIDRGKLLVHETLARLTSRLQGQNHAVDASFARPVPEEALNASFGGMPGVGRVERLDASRVRVYVDGGLEARERLLKELVGLPWGLVGLQESQNPLEELYLSRIERGD